MPSFGRIGRHHNRSQHALPVVEQQQSQAPGPAPAPAPGGGGGEAAPRSGPQDSRVEAGNNAAGPGGVAPPPLSSASSSGLANPNSSNPASPAGFSSNESLEAQAAQQQQRQSEPPPHHHPQEPQQQQQSASLSHAAPPHLHHPKRAGSSSANSLPPTPTPAPAPMQDQGVGGPSPVQVSSAPAPFNQHQSPHPHDLSLPATHHPQGQEQGQGGHHFEYPPPHLPPQQQIHHPQFSGSTDDIHKQQVGLAISSPSVSSPSPSSTHGNRHQQQQQQHPALPHPSYSQPLGRAPPPQLHQQQHQQHVQQQVQKPPPEPKRSARNIIKGIFTGSNRDSQQQSSSSQGQSSHDNTSGLGHRPSKRLSKTPAPNLRYSVSQLSQASVDQDPSDWQNQQYQHQHQQQQVNSPHTFHSQHSPLPGVGEIDENYRVRHSDATIRLKGQPPLSLSTTTVRQVHPDHDPSSPYHELDPSQQQHIVPQLQLHQDSPDQIHGSLDSLQYQQLQQQLQEQQLHPYPKPPPQGQYRTSLTQLYTDHPPTSQLQQNFDASSQVSRESPVVESNPSSAPFLPTQPSPVPTPASQTSLDHPLPPLPTQATQDPAPQDQAMAPPSQGVPSSRRSQEADKAMRAQESQLAAPPTYRHGSAATPASSNPTFRGAPAGQDRIAYDGTGDPGRNSPQPEREDPEKAFKDLLTKYKNVKRLYFENKAQIDQMSGQIEHLQNAVANQRMSQSRTALDDSEYATRFNRLNGAIHNLSFNIRKDWRLVPRWLDRYVSQDALKTGKQEMTAVGRAIITRWILEEVFNRCFHPALDPVLSRRLKEIELGIRSSSYKLSSQEEFDALTAKVIGWRMATLEGLAPELAKPEAAENRAEFTRKVTENMLSTLMQYLSDDPPPAGVDGSASMIVELAVGIAANIPLESRDVVIRYPLPGDVLDPMFMEVEKAGLPSLDGQGGSGAEGGEDGDEESGEDKSGSKERRKGSSGWRAS
ncbi:uncharacterized protein DNG_03761 [Cephalotrichum gorgonifer]|uniref:S-adenosylmethionine-dependent methyltransferase-like protein n=1 Tax=Cephalotrichum gorgonifer TaxID=2041049 RepID=A0AAE8MWT2_9PEZI|nr:uncharacterized protein DNG_03761 [Cephalotrichum gorgonifer]